MQRYSFLFFSQYTFIEHTINIHKRQSTTEQKLQYSCLDKKKTCVFNEDEKYEFWW